MLRLFTAAIACASLLHAVDIEDRVRKSAPASSATRLALNAEFGGIRVQSGEGQNVEVEVYFRGDPDSRKEFDRMLHDFALSVTHEGSDIRVSGTFHDGWKPQSVVWILNSILMGSHRPICRNGQCLEYSSWLREVEYRITVPRKFDADVATAGGPISVSRLTGAVNARTSGGGLTFENIDGAVNGRTSGGGIVVRAVNGPALVRTSGGAIRITEVTQDVDASTSGGPILIERNSGRVRAQTSGGGIEIRDATGAFEATTSGGAVTASLAAQPKDGCRLSTSGGNITVKLAPGIHMDLDAAATGGRVWTDFPLPRRSHGEERELRAPLNGGGPLLRLRTSGGGIDVRRG